jgi:hypothetical protein
MAQSDDSEYYSSRASKLMRGFDRVARRVQKRLAETHDAEFAREVVADARDQFQRLIPELPYVGGRKNAYSRIIVVNGWIIALTRAMEARGKTVEETIAVCAHVADGLFAALPPFLLRLMGRLIFTRPARRFLERQAARSQQRRYPEDWVYSIREGDDGEVSLEFSECGVHKLWDAQGLQGAGPYCSFFDVTYSRHMGLGLDATHTLGTGCETCRLRFKRGRETIIPDALRGVLPRTE